MEKLLRLPKVKSISPIFVSRLLAAFESRRRQSITPIPIAETLVEPLSDRELEVLQHLNSYLSTPEIAGVMGNRGQVNYAAAKVGLIGATKALAQELVSRAITVNAIAPGLIETDMIAGAPVDELLKRIPARRLGKPEEVAAVIGFLASPQSSFVTGAQYAVGGGIEA